MFDMVPLFPECSMSTECGLFIEPPHPVRKNPIAIVKQHIFIYTLFIALKILVSYIMTLHFGLMFFGLPGPAFATYNSFSVTRPQKSLLVLRVLHLFSFVGPVAAREFKFVF